MWGGGEFGRLVLWRGLEAAQGVERCLLLGVAGVGGAGLGLLLVVLLLGGGEFGGGLCLRVFEGDEGFGEGVVLGLQGFGFEVVVCVGWGFAGGLSLFEAGELLLGFAQAVRGAVVAVFGVVTVFALGV